MVLCEHTFRYALYPSLPQDHLTALMEVNEENQTLTKQFQREKQRRKELEDVSVGEHLGVN